MTEPNKILIVEDQGIVAADIEATLKSFGHDVVAIAASGEEAIRYGEQFRPDLVLMDISLQGDMDGIEAAKRINQTLDVPVVYLTAYADDETVARARQTGPFGYLVKPYDDSELHAAIEVALSKYRSDLWDREQDLKQARREERRRTTEEAEQRFRLLIKGVNDYAIFMLDDRGCVSTWNPGAMRITGYKAGEIVGQSFATFFENEEQRQKRAQKLLTLADTESGIRDEGWLLRKDSSRFWAETTVTPIRESDGNLAGFAIVTRDLTGQKYRRDARQFLDQATVALTAHVEQSPLGEAARQAVSFLADGCLLDLVDATTGALDSVLAHRDSSREAELRCLEESLSRADYIEDFIATEEPVVEDGHFSAGDTSISDGTGKATPMYLQQLQQLGARAWLLVPVDIRGEVGGLVTFFRENPRPYTEREIEVAREFVRRTGLALENARLYQQARDAIAARDEFLAVASHELRTPLTPLRLQMEILTRILDASQVEGEEIFSTLDIFSRQVERLTNLVDGLLDVSRIMTGRLHLERKRFDLADVVEESVDSFRDEARKAGSSITLRQCVSAEGNWDRMRLEQVVSNLLSNAIKYGNGKPIEVKLDADEDAAFLTVRDHGVGMDDEALSRIFERFERAVSPRNYGGLGLGLYITRQIVEAHGGTIEVTSQPNRGSTFTVHLPRTTETPTAA